MSPPPPLSTTTPDEESSLLPAAATTSTRRNHDEIPPALRLFNVYSSKQSSSSSSSSITPNIVSSSMRTEYDDHAQQQPRNQSSSPFSFIASLLKNIRGTMKSTSSSSSPMMTNNTNTGNGMLLSTITLNIAWTTSIIQDFIEWNLRGIGQVYFCNNPVTGAFILAGLFVQSYKVAIYGLMGVLTGTLAAFVMNYDRSLIAAGLFGYNPFLVGLAIATFHPEHQQQQQQPHPEGNYPMDLVLGVVLTSIFCTVLFQVMGRWFQRWDSPVFTFPFNISTMIYLLIVSNVHWTTSNASSSSHSWSSTGLDIFLHPLECWISIMRGFGQVFLADHLLCCILVMIGIGLCSRILFWSALFGGSLGVIFAVLVESDVSRVIEGLWSYNASLTFAGICFFYVPSGKGVVMGVGAVMLTVWVQYVLSTWILSPMGLPVMTLPFCIASFCSVWLQYHARVKGFHSLFVPPVPLAAIVVPEEHVRRNHVLHDAFYMILKTLHTDHHHHQQQQQQDNDFDVDVDARVRRLVPTRKTVVVLKEIANCICGGGGADASGAMTLLSKQDLDGEWDVDGNAERIFKELDSQHSGHITGRTFMNYLVNHLGDVQVNLVNKAFHLLSVGVEGSYIMDMKNFVVFSRVSLYLNHLKSVFVDLEEILALHTGSSSSSSSSVTSPQELSMQVLNEMLFQIMGDHSVEINADEYEYLCFQSCSFDGKNYSQGDMNAVQLRNFILASFLTCGVVVQ